MIERDGPTGHSNYPGLGLESTTISPCPRLYVRNYAYITRVAQTSYEGSAKRESECVPLLHVVYLTMLPSSGVRLDLKELRCLGFQRLP